MFGAISKHLRNKLTKYFLVLFLVSCNSSIYADATEDMLEKLTNTHGVSGFEYPVRDLLERYWSKYKIDYERDGVGNLVGVWRANTGKKPKILIMAHMDEVGFLVKSIDLNGFINVIPLGGWMDHVLWSQNWTITTPTHEIPAVSGMDPPHVLTDFTKSPVVNKNMLFLDTGKSLEELKKMGVRPGVPVTPTQAFKKLSAKKYVGKAFDDRVGLVLMIDMMRQISYNSDILKSVDIVFAATVQEELGMRGSKAVYESLKPDLVLNIEAGIAKDYPTQFANDKGPALAKGPALFIYDGSMVPNSKLVSFMAVVAEKNNIPIQWESEVSYGQDASCLQTAGRGMPAINIGVPIRYAHSHIGMMDRDDYNNTLALLVETLKSLDSVSVKSFF